MAGDIRMEERRVHWNEPERGTGTQVPLRVSGRTSSIKEALALVSYSGGRNLKLRKIVVFSIYTLFFAIGRKDRLSKKYTTTQI